MARIAAINNPIRSVLSGYGISNLHFSSLSIKHQAGVELPIPREKATNPIPVALGFSSHFSFNFSCPKD